MTETAAESSCYVGLDPVRRPRILADGYRMSADERAEFLDVIDEVTAAEREELAARVKAGDAALLKAFDDGGGWATWDRMQAWLVDQRAMFLAALIR